MVRTYGLTHIALAVRDLERSVRFYAACPAPGRWSLLAALHLLGLGIGLGAVYDRSRAGFGVM